MWYKIWTTVAEQIPLIVVGVILMAIACLYVGSQKKYVCPRCDNDVFTITIK